MNTVSTTQHSNAAAFDRTRTVIVPNLGGFAGVSYCFPDAKLSLGYRADFFFGAMDGGIDTRRTGGYRIHLVLSLRSVSASVTGEQPGGPFGSRHIATRLGLLYCARRRRAASLFALLRPPQIILDELLEGFPRPDCLVSRSRPSVPQRIREVRGMVRDNRDRIEGERRPRPGGGWPRPRSTLGSCARCCRWRRP